jgi:hypothetical protein
LAIGAVADQSPAASTTVKIARKNPRIKPHLTSLRPVPAGR